MRLTRPLLAASWRSWVASDLQRVGPYWLQLVWTFVFCAALAVPFTVMGFAVFARGEGAWRNWGGWAEWYGRNLVVCLTIGYLIHGLFEVAIRLMGPRRMRALKGWRATLFHTAVPLTGVAIGWPLGLMLVLGHMPSWFKGEQAANTITGAVMLSVFITFGLHMYFAARARQAEAERRASEAQLRLLQAQMEPHFLFNTLANVQGLIDHAPAQAKQMLEAFTDYLRASLTQLRQADSTVAAELALAEAYLQLLATRMHDRLRYTLVASEEARNALLPPLLLQPLVENALHHGLEPKIEGGQLHISAAVANDVLTLEVRDNGLGLHAPPRRATRAGAGIALDNLRQRLHARFGERASFTLSDAAPGAVARISMPFETAASPP
jgi:two-component sensor histidine kinase